MLVLHGDGYAARGLEHHGVRRLPLPQQKLPFLEFLALQVGGDAGKTAFAAEFVL